MINGWVVCNISDIARVESESQHPHKYQIKIAFVYRISSVSDSENFFSILGRHDALGIGHEKTETSTMLIASEEPLNLEKSDEDLGDIKILEIRQY